MMQPLHRAHVFLALMVVFVLVAGSTFRRQWTRELHYPEPATPTVEHRMLSHYHPALEGTPGDTEVIIFDSGEPGGTLLICGGTHPNEPAGYIAAVVALENMRVTRGRAIVVARSNASGFSHNDSQDASVQRYGIDTPHGRRLFRNGSRFTNPVHQWPDPTVYINPRGDNWEENHALFCCESSPCSIGNPGPGGQTLAGVDSRNLNRVFPGREDGTLTEQVAWAIIQLIRAEEVDLAFDYHEASPEYPTINVMVAHERAQSLTAWAELGLYDDGITISTEASSLRLRGLSHREWGDHSNALSILFETANPAMGRLKGRTSEDQITLGYDGAYMRLQAIQNRLNDRLRQRQEELSARGESSRESPRRILQITMPPEGIPLSERVGRHVQTTIRLLEAYNMEYFDKEIAIENLPTYDQLIEHGIGPFIAGPNGEPPTGVL